MVHRRNYYDTNLQIIDWINGKKKEIENKKEEYDQMLDTLNKMLQYRALLMDDPEKAQEMLKTWRAYSKKTQLEKILH